MNCKRKLLALSLSVSLLSSFLAGCGADTTVSGQDTAPANDTETLDSKDMFTDRDKEVGYDENSSVLITLADSGSACSDSAVDIDGNTITIRAEGTYIISGSLSDGQLIVDAPDKAKLHLILDSAAIGSDTSAAVYVRQADKVFLTLAPNTVNTLSTASEYVQTDDSNIDAVIFSKCDLTLNGSGSLRVSSAYGHGIVSKDDLVFTGGNYEITAQNHALSGKDSVRIADGSFLLTAGKDGIHSENPDKEDKGFIYISGGEFDITSSSDAIDGECAVQIEGGKLNISAKDDGIHSERDLIISGGTIDIAESYEGLEGMTITISDGDIHIISSDDGLNAAGDGTNTEDSKPKDFDGEGFPEPPGDFDGQEFPGRPGDFDGGPDSGFGGGPGGFGGFEEATDYNHITINGGKLCVEAGGDGIDSNGSLTITGGEIYVYGPTNGGNGALDYAGTAEISGGTIVAVGSSGMAQNFGSSSTQGSMLVTVADKLLTGELTLTDADGNTLVSCSPTKSYNSVVISCPALAEGQTYTLLTGDMTTTIEMTSLIYGTDDMFGGFWKK